MDWLQIGTTLGLPTLFLVGIAVFVAKQVWPFIVKRVEANDARLVLHNEALIKAMTDNATINARTLTVLEDMNRNIQALKQPQPQARQRGSNQP